MNEKWKKLEEEAHQLGCGWFGIAPAQALDKDLEHLREWLEKGSHGDMAWLARDPGRRADPSLVLDDCKSVIVLGLNYLRAPLGDDDPQPPPAGQGKVSKYARTRDYHRVFEKILKQLARLIDNELCPGSKTRGYVDYGPVMERPWAARAGLGFIGKHTLLIHPREGSFHFLAVLLTTADLAKEAPPTFPHTEGCGDCRRCIDACPTGAITEPHKLDARKCLSYLTIEKEGPIPKEYWHLTRGYIFGCDICQDVCPYNRKRAPIVGEDSPLGPSIVPETIPLTELIRGSQGVLDRLGGTASPLKRAGADSLTRNALAAATTGCDSGTLEAIHDLIGDETRPHWLREMACEVAATVKLSVAQRKVE